MRTKKRVRGVLVVSVSPNGGFTIKEKRGDKPTSLVQKSNTGRTVND